MSREKPEVGEWFVANDPENCNRTDWPVGTEVKIVEADNPQLMLCEDKSGTRRWISIDQLSSRCGPSDNPAKVDLPKVGERWGRGGSAEYFVGHGDVCTGDLCEKKGVPQHRRLLSTTDNRVGFCPYVVADCWEKLRLIENPAKVDWTKYLPKEPLPDTGPKEFKLGQVWAVFSPIDKGQRNIGPAVVRVIKLSDIMRSWCGCEWLAGDRMISGMGCNLDGGAERGLHAILIQDVNDPAPRPVEDKRCESCGSPKHPDCGERPDLGPLLDKLFPQPTPQPPTGKAQEPKADECGCDDEENIDHRCEVCGEEMCLACACKHSCTPKSRPRPEGMSEADVSMLVAARYPTSQEAPRGTSEAELEELANPWRKRP